jgi:AcrR family transcriptional regulator
MVARKAAVTVPAAKRHRNSSPPTMGRPRSEDADAAILQAAVKLLDERGYHAMTVDDIASVAGVGKQTIYRRWQSKAAVVLEALTARTAAEVATPDTGSVQEDVRTLLRSAFRVLRVGRQKVVVTLMAEAQLNDDFAEAFRERFIARRRKALTDLIVRGIQRGEMEPGTDAEFVADMIYGPMWYRLLNRHAPIDDQFADQLSAYVFSRTVAGRARPEPM